MDGFLVLLCHTMDDLPIGLYETYERAMRIGRGVSEMPTASIRDLFQTDCSTPVCVKVVQFQGGVPVAIHLVKEFD